MALRDIVGKLFAKRAPQPAPAEEPAPAAPEPPPPQRHWDSDMRPLAAGRGEPIEHSGGGYIRCGTVRLAWASRETDGEGKPLRTRTPEGRVEIMPYNDFTAAGKPYAALHQLVKKWDGPSSAWARDIYGRAVLSVAERFPCFDSSDYLYEDRYFRWFLLCEGGKLTSVYHTDKTDTVTVTEDVLDLEDPCWKKMLALKCFEDADA